MKDPVELARTHSKLKGSFHQGQPVIGGLQHLHTGFQEPARIPLLSRARDDLEGILGNRKGAPWVGEARPDPVLEIGQRPATTGAKGRAAVDQNDAVGVSVQGTEGLERTAEHLDGTADLGTKKIPVRGIVAKKDGATGPPCALPDP